MGKVIFLVGIPASGKSTWTANYIKDHENDVNQPIVLSRDALRRMRGKYMVMNQEPMISKWMNDCFKHALDMEYCDIIIDNTNLKEDYIYNFINILNNHKNKDYFDVYIKVFDTDLNLCIWRNKEGRPENERVPLDVVANMYKQFMDFVKTDRFTKFIEKNNIKIYKE